MGTRKVLSRCIVVKAYRLNTGALCHNGLVLQFVKTKKKSVNFSCRRKHVLMHTLPAPSCISTSDLFALCALRRCTCPSIDQNSLHLNPLLISPVSACVCMCVHRRPRTSNQTPTDRIDSLVPSFPCQLLPWQPLFTLSFQDPSNWQVCPSFPSPTTYPPTSLLLSPSIHHQQPITFTRQVRIKGRWMEG